MLKQSPLVFVLILGLVLMLIISCSGEGKQTEQKEKNGVALINEKLPVTSDMVKAKEQVTTEKASVKKDSKKVPLVIFVELGSVNCIPCKMMQPVMKEIEEVYKDKVKVVFYDVRTEKDAEYAKQYKIRVIPTQVFLDKDGKEFFRHEGYYPKEEIEALLKKQGVNK
ncbi:MAG: thioredoxin family protein [Candidatus Firestonebacteria bacterium]